MDIDYDSMIALTAVVREGRFDEAARALNVTQSAVSQRIKQLEEKVGAVLIVRGRPCVPTEAGLHICRHVEQVSLLQHELTERMRGLDHSNDATAATIRISVNNDSLATWFPSVIKRATRDLNVRFDLVTDDQEHTEKNLRSGDALAVVTSNEDPIQQIVRYVNQVREGKYKTPEGRKILVSENTPFYGYVVCDLTAKVERWLEFEKDYKPMPDKLGWFRWHDNINLYLEVVSWDKVLRDAEMRNRIFFHKLGIN